MCPISAMSAKVAKAKVQMKELARNGTVSSQTIVRNILSQHDEETIANLPTNRTLNREIRNVRSGSTQTANFQNVSEIFFGNEIQHQNECILIHDSGSDDPERLLVFSNSILIQHAQTCTIFSSDGTFKACPRVYNSNNTNGQLWTIHCYKQGIQVPIFYALMKKRRESNYKNVLDVTMIANNINPTKFMVDFEKPEMKAIQSKFSGCEISGCYFHFQGVIFLSKKDIRDLCR